MGTASTAGVFVLLITISASLGDLSRMGPHPSSPEFRVKDGFFPSHYDLEVQLPIDIRSIEESRKEEGEGAVGKVRIVGMNKVTRNSILLQTYWSKVNESTVSVVVRGSSPGKSIPVRGIKQGEATCVIDLEGDLLAGQEVEISLSYVTGMVSCALSWVLPFCSESYSQGGSILSLFGSDKKYYQAIPNTPYRVFPSFDEPHLKATFDMTIVRKQGFTSIFHTPLVSSTPDPERPGWVVDKFARTPELAPSVIGWFVSPFTHVEATTKSNKTIQVHTPKHLMLEFEDKEKLEILAQRLATIITSYDEYFNDSYHLSKMDYIIPPKPSGGSFVIPWTSWGITINEKDNSEVFKKVKDLYQSWKPELNLVQDVSRLSYLMARQWVGNLWNRNKNMYMNLPLARFIHYAQPDPALRMYMELSDREVAMEDVSSSLKDSEPVQIHDPTFPAINSGAPLLNMMESVLGKRVMQQALQSYVKNVQNGNSPPGQDDLFQTLGKAAVDNNVQFPPGLNVPTLMSNWASQPGYPVVRISLVNETHVKLVQQPITTDDEEDDGHNKEKPRWVIPVTYVTPESERLNNYPIIWLENDGSEKIVPINTSESWLLANPEGVGYYRVLYDSQLLRKLQNVSHFSEPKRAVLLADLIALKKEGYVSVGDILDQTKNFGKEKSLMMWKSFLNFFPFSRFTSHPSYPQIREYLVTRLNAALTALNSSFTPPNSAEASLVSTLKDEFSQYLCPLDAESSHCANYSREILSLLKADNERPHGEKIPDGVKCAMVASNSEAFQFVFDTYEKHPDSQQLAKALGCTRQSQQADKLIQRSIDRGDVKLLLSLSSNFHGQGGQWELVWKFISANIDHVMQKFGDGKPEPVARILDSLATHLCTDEQLKQVTQFTESNKDKLREERVSIQASIYKIRSNIAWMNNKGKEYVSWFNNNK